MTEKITSENYVENVLRTESPGNSETVARLTEPQTIRLLHAAMGMVTEAAELLDMLKKHIFYGKILDLINAKEEIGDSQWYSGDKNHSLLDSSLWLGELSVLLSLPSKRQTNPQ